LIIFIKFVIVYHGLMFTFL